MTSTTVIADAAQIDKVREDLAMAAEVAKAGVAQAMGIVSGEVPTNQAPTLTQIGSLSMLATDLEAESKSLSYASIRLREALVRLDEMRRHEEQPCRGCGKMFPFDPEADFCPSCSAENAGEKFNG
ncbi:MAG: hypothetical protein WBB76_04900 [Gaiellaceae bacterium]